MKRSSKQGREWRLTSFVLARCYCLTVPEGNNLEGRRGGSFLRGGSVHCWLESFASGSLKQNITWQGKFAHNMVAGSRGCDPQIPYKSTTLLTRPDLLKLCRLPVIPWASEQALSTGSLGVFPPISLSPFLPSSLLPSPSFYLSLHSAFSPLFSSPLPSSYMSLPHSLLFSFPILSPSSPVLCTPFIPPSWVALPYLLLHSHFLSSPYLPSLPLLFSSFSHPFLPFFLISSRNKAYLT